jgi:hypothetical protein
MSDYSECYKLAMYWLGEKATAIQADRLAMCIMDRIEDELFCWEQKPVEQRGDGRWEK